jgi:hypothetical protein
LLLCSIKCLCFYFLKKTWSKFCINPEKT